MKNSNMFTSAEKTFLNSYLPMLDTTTHKCVGGDLTFDELMDSIPEDFAEITPTESEMSEVISSLKEKGILVEVEQVISLSENHYSNHTEYMKVLGMRLVEAKLKLNNSINFSEGKTEDNVQTFYVPVSNFKISTESTITGKVKTFYEGTFDDVDNSIGNSITSFFKRSLDTKFNIILIDSMGNDIVSVMDIKRSTVGPEKSFIGSSFYGLNILKLKI